LLSLTGYLLIYGDFAVTSAERYKVSYTSEAAASSLETSYLPTVIDKNAAELWERSGETGFREIAGLAEEAAGRNTNISVKHAKAAPLNLSILNQLAYVKLHYA